jgi:hypothetical protein
MDDQRNYDTLVFFDANVGILLGPFALPATGPAYVQSDGPSGTFFFEGSGNTDIPHTPVDFHAYVTPYSCIDGWPRSFRRLLCSSVRFNTSGHCPETLSRCIPTP